MTIRLGTVEFTLNGNQRYAAAYVRYTQGFADAWHDSPDEAAQALNTGEEYGDFSSSGIYDTETGTWLAQRRDPEAENYVDGYVDWEQHMALEVPVRVVSSREAEDDGR